MSEADITPDWQDRAAALRKLIRECQHVGEKKRNADSQKGTQPPSCGSGKAVPL